MYRSPLDGARPTNFCAGRPGAIADRSCHREWVKRSKFGVDFDMLQPKVAERITTLISTLVKTPPGTFRKG